MILENSGYNTTKHIPRIKIHRTNETTYLKKYFLALALSIFRLVWGISGTPAFDKLLMISLPLILIEYDLGQYQEHNAQNRQNNQ